MVTNDIIIFFSMHDYIYVEVSDNTGEPYLDQYGVGVMSGASFPPRTSTSAFKIQFDTRFCSFDNIANEIKVFQYSIDTDIEILAPELQMETIIAQCNDVIKNKYQNSSLSEFYKSFPMIQFDNLYKFCNGLFSVFGTTCVREHSPK